SNLVSNAIKFTDNGSVSATVQRLEKSGRSQLLFKVTDSGIGISPEAGKTLFAPFRQLESSEERRFEGTGLGLAISKNLVGLMGGNVWFESQPGEGTIFFFTVDYQVPTDTREESARELVSRGKINDPKPDPETRDKIRVLLVEDNKVNQKVASLTLQQLGCEVTVANNGKEAIDLADGPLNFDLICMDVNMPVMDGIKATAEIRQLDHFNAKTKILAMTGMAFEEDRENCLEAGMDDVITKPFDIADLRERIGAIQSQLTSSVVLPS
ncbi:MAG: response regulator, partial [Verrucomicrobiota bacterium]